MARSSDPQKVAAWKRRMARFHASGKSVARFCGDEGVSVPSFYQWRKKLSADDKRQPQKDSHDALISDTFQAFTPVRVVGSPCVAVRLPGGMQMEIPTADPQALQLAIQTLAQVDAGRRAGGESCSA